MSRLSELLANAKAEMGPKLFAQFKKDMASPEKMNAKPYVPCSCNGTGFVDKVDRGDFAMEPRELLCPECLGRGWK